MAQHSSLFGEQGDLGVPDVALAETDTARQVNNRTVSLSTAGVRAVAMQLLSIYLRTPVKLFRPSRFDYMAQARIVANHHGKILEKPWRIHTHSSLALLIQAVRAQGWRFVPENVLPPLLANSVTGIILYTTYLTSLDHFSQARMEGTNTLAATSSLFHNEKYHFIDTWKAGFIAGAAQSLAAAPIDAIYTRLLAAELLSGRHQNLWVYGYKKLCEVGMVGVFAGFGGSLIKETLGFAFYFSTFELVRNKGYHAADRVFKNARAISSNMRHYFAKIGLLEPPVSQTSNLDEKRLMRVLKSTFVLLAGASAAFSLLAVQFPLSKVQTIHLSRLEALDILSSTKNETKPFTKIYYHSYLDTIMHLKKIHYKAGSSWFRLAYTGFGRHALSTIPATSVGLLAFEIMRSKLAENLEDDS